MAQPADLEGRLWRAADELWCNSSLQPSEYALPVLGLLFLKYAERRGGRDLELPDEARLERLLALPVKASIGRALDHAMKGLESRNPTLAHALPRGYAKLDAATLRRLLGLFDAVPDVSGDALGRIYEYFLGRFAPRTLQKGGEFYTPSSVVELLVAILAPYEGSLYDPACGSGGMFVQSARFVAARAGRRAGGIRVRGVEKVTETARLARMNLAVHGLVGDIRVANAYYDDPHDAVGRFDFVMANPPFNQSGVDRARVARGSRRFPFGAPTVDNANYLWMQLFHSSLRAGRGRAGFVMASGAVDARGSERVIRERILESGVVDAIVALSPNLFYTVTLPATLWFFDAGKARAGRARSVLFVDGRRHFRQINRAHRELTGAQIELLANVVRLYRGEPVEDARGGGLLTREHFPRGTYEDVPGLCRIASLREIAANGSSLHPGRYVRPAGEARADDDFEATLTALHDRIDRLSAAGRELERAIQKDVAWLRAR